jgi:hypothetical protein
MVYVVMLMVFVTVLFAGTAAALNRREVIADKTLEKQQLQLTAQSALNAVKSEFLSNEELWNHLEQYAKGNQSANFTLTENTGITDEVTVKVTHEGGTKARLTVTASNDGGSISSAFTVLDWGEDAPTAEAAGVTDNLIVAFWPDGIRTEGDKILGSNPSTLERLNIEGNVIVNNYNKDRLTVKGPSSIGSIYASGNMYFTDFTTGSINEDADSKIVSVYGNIESNNHFSLPKGFSLLAARYGYKHMTDGTPWDNPELKIVTGIGSDFEMNNNAICGTFGAILSGGNANVRLKDGMNLTADSVEALNNITWFERGGSNTTINDSLISGGDIQLGINGATMDAKNIVAYKNITGNDYEGLNLDATYMYAGNSISLRNISRLVALGMRTGNTEPTLSQNWGATVNVRNGSFDYQGLLNEVVSTDSRKSNLEREIEKTFTDAENEFSKSIPDINQVPTITIPGRAGLVYKTVQEYANGTGYATLRADGNNLEVISDGYIRVAPNGNDARAYVAQNEAGEVVEFAANDYRNLVFDITNESRNIALGTAGAENGFVTDGNTDINLQLSICVQQDAEYKNYVRIFADENCNLNLGRGEVKNLTDSDVIPELYFLSNGYKAIRTFDKGGSGYYLTGYIVAPKCMINFKNCLTHDKKAFEGIIICGNISMPAVDNGRLVYHQPTSNGITEDVYGYSN